jgi:hypothetical protein
MVRPSRLSPWDLSSRRPVPGATHWRSVAASNVHYGGPSASHVCSRNFSEAIRENLPVVIDPVSRDGTLRAVLRTLFCVPLAELDRSRPLLCR